MSLLLLPDPVWYIFHLFRSVMMGNWLPRIVSYHGLEYVRLPDAPASVAMRYWWPVCARYNQDKYHSLASPLSQWDKQSHLFHWEKVPMHWQPKYWLLFFTLFDLSSHELDPHSCPLTSSTPLKNKGDRKGSFEWCEWWMFQSIISQPFLLPQSMQ